MTNTPQPRTAKTSPVREDLAGGNASAIFSHSPAMGQSVAVTVSQRLRESAQEQPKTDVDCPSTADRGSAMVGTGGA